MPNGQAPEGAGYGTQTKHIVKGIQSLGHEVAVFAWWGLMGGPVTLDGVLHFPAQLDGYGNDATPYYARKWHADLLVTLIDIWVLDQNALGNIGGTRWTPYFPIDHADPIPKAIAERFERANRLIVYSRWAERLVKEYAEGRYAAKVRYIPHGIDVETITPVRRAERAAIRRRIFPDWPDNAFVAGMVAANKGFPSRKSFPEVMEAFARFSSRHPEARLYLHSYPHKDFQGPPLDEMAMAYGIADKVRFPNPKMMLGGGFDDKLVADIYRSFDVLLAPSQGEGFGLPIVEAQAAGVPVIVNDHSAMSELVGGGWRLRPRHLHKSLLWGNFAEADPDEIEHALEECYRVPNPDYLRAAARDFSIRYAWPKVIGQYWAPFLEEMDGGRRDLSRHLQEIRTKGLVAV